VVIKANYVVQTVLVRYIAQLRVRLTFSPHSFSSLVDINSLIIDLEIDDSFKTAIYIQPQIKL
jgi:hypothetical protein